MIKPLWSVVPVLGLALLICLAVACGGGDESDGGTSPTATARSGTPEPTEVEDVPYEDTVKVTVSLGCEGAAGSQTLLMAVKVVDFDGNPVINATVAAQAAGPAFVQSSETTDDNGEATLQFAIAEPGDYEATAYSVTGADGVEIPIAYDSESEASLDTSGTCAPPPDIP